MREMSVYLIKPNPEFGGGWYNGLALVAASSPGIARELHVAYNKNVLNEWWCDLEDAEERIEHYESMYLPPEKALDLIANVPSAKVLYHAFHSG